MRYAALRARALGKPAADQLYGNSLALDSSTSPATVTGSDEIYMRIAELELRLSDTMGIEVGHFSNSQRQTDAD